MAGYDTPWGVQFGNSLNLSSGFFHLSYASNPSAPGLFQLHVASNPVYGGLIASGAFSGPKGSGLFINDADSENVNLSSGTITTIDADGNRYWDATTQTAFIAPQYVLVSPASGFPNSGYPLYPFKYQPIVH
jgi:hypothetical protein